MSPWASTYLLHPSAVVTLPRCIDGLVLLAAAARALVIVQELCESRGGRAAGLSVPTSLLVSVDVKLY